MWTVLAKALIKEFDPALFSCTPLTCRSSLAEVLVFRILRHLKYRTLAWTTGLMIVQERENTHLDIQECALDIQKAEFIRSETTLVYSLLNFCCLACSTQLNFPCAFSGSMVGPLEATALQVRHHYAVVNPTWKYPKMELLVSICGAVYIADCHGEIRNKVQ